MMPQKKLLYTNNRIDENMYFMFHYNQLTDVLHSRYPENDVHYRYGEQGAVANRAGRIMFQEDASGWQTFSYGKLGEVTENIPIFARVSRTQTQTNTQPNMHSTHYP